MKKGARLFIVVICIGLASAGCQTTTTPSSSPQEWLREQPFELAPSEWSEVITSGLPEGFECEGPFYETEGLPSGDSVQLTRVEYQRLIDGQVSTEDTVQVGIMSFASQTNRSELLDLLTTEDVEWDYQQFDDGLVARFHTSGFGGRIWVSGPYLIMVFDNVDGRGQWVDTFTELYLTQPPSARTSILNLTEWLKEQPFEPAPSEWPQVITDGLPEGFNILDPDQVIEELPSGETVQVTQVKYQRPVGGQVTSGNEVQVIIFAFESITGRSEYLDSSPWKGYGLSIQQFSGGQAAIVDQEGTIGRIWIQGPYLIVVYNNEEEQGPWGEAFTELYLDQPPSLPPPNSLDWLREQPFEPAPDEYPQIITYGLPEGFDVVNFDFSMEVLSSGEQVQITYVEYRNDKIDGIFTVEIIGYKSIEARSKHLDILEVDFNYAWTFEQLDHGRVARYQDSWDDGRAWVSGPYLIKVYSVGEEMDRSPWVNAFAELYLAQPPAPMPTLILIDWLKDKPFEPATTVKPEFVTSELPEGFEVGEPEYGTGELSNGDMVEMAFVTYRLDEEDWIVVIIYTFSSASGRAELLDEFADSGNLTSELQDWTLDKFNGDEVAHYWRPDESMLWVSGPYLIMIQSRVYDPGPWLGVFTEMFLGRYPAE